MYARQPSAVYQIRNTLNGKVYVGSAVNPGQRWGQHRTDLRGGKHINRHLQAAWLKYGEAVFVFEILENVTDPKDLIAREQHHLDALCASDPKRGYNIETKAGSSLGVKRSDAAKQKMREIALRRPRRKHSPATRAKIGDAQRGVKRGPRSAESKEKQRQALRGRCFSEEHKLNIGLALKGRQFSVSHREKLRQAQLGKVASEEARRKMGEVRQGHKHSESTKQKIREANRGHTVSEETRRKISESKRRKLSCKSW